MFLGAAIRKSCVKARGEKAKRSGQEKGVDSSQTLPNAFEAALFAPACVQMSHQLLTHAETRLPGPVSLLLTPPLGVPRAFVASSRAASPLQADLRLSGPRQSCSGGPWRDPMAHESLSMGSPSWGGGGLLEHLHVCSWAYVLVLMGFASVLLLAGVGVSSMFAAVVNVNLLSFF